MSLMKHEFSRQTFEENSNIKFHQIHLVRADLLHADGQTDMRKLMVAFRNFAKELKKNAHELVGF